MKQQSYLVIAPAVQDRFWSRATPLDRPAVGHEGIARTGKSPQVSEQTQRPRQKIPFGALVDYWITYSIPWHILELGTESALVKMDTTGLQVGDRTDFVLRFKVDCQPSEHHIPARVEKIEPQGVTLRFDDYTVETRRDLVKLLHAL